MTKYDNTIPDVKQFGETIEGTIRMNPHEVISRVQQLREAMTLLDHAENLILVSDIDDDKALAFCNSIIDLKQDIMT